MTKRMNLPVTNLERSVAKWSEILATNRPFPDLYAQECIGALDFASIRDFAACGLLFRQNGEYILRLIPLCVKNLLIFIMVILKSWRV